MRLTFIGADHEVTGSLHYLEACGQKIVIDCGMEQGKNHYENAELPIKYSDIDYILLTHAHIDHSGMLPLAYKNGFSGTIVTTMATQELSEIMLRDCAHIQQSDADYKNRKSKRRGDAPVTPIYDVNDANNVLEHFRGVHYDTMVNLADGLDIRFIDAGHLLGSASIEVFVNEGGDSKKLVFSGDIGNFNKPLIKDPTYITDADYVIMESTYGDRTHDEHIDHLTDLVNITQRTLDRGGNVVIPAFAVGRTQELLYLFRKIKADNLVHGHDGFPVYVDSPLAVEATQVFSNHLMECYDDETRELVSKGINPIGFKGLNLTITSQESQMINIDEVPKVIISAAGMCDAGRIRHHIKHNLWRPESTIVFAGYQAEGTLGRTLLDGAESVKLFGEEIVVKAEIATMAAMSSHADQNGLLKWIGAYEKAPKRVFLVHGDDGSMETLAGLIRDKYKLDVECPYSGSSFNLTEDKWEKVCEGIPYVKENDPLKVITGDVKAPKRGMGSPAYNRLVSAYNKLLSAIKANCGGTNADLQKFTDQILNLYDKWIR